MYKSSKMPKRFQTPSLSNPSSNRTMEFHEMNREGMTPTAPGIVAVPDAMQNNPTSSSERSVNATAPEYTPTEAAMAWDSELPPPYSAVVGWTDSPNSYLPGKDKYPAQLAITKQPVSERTYPQPGDSRIPLPPDTAVDSPRLEHLATVDQLIVHQRSEFLQGYETELIKYTVKTSSGQEFFHGKEATICCDRQCCGSLCPFELVLKNNTGVQVLHLSRDVGCGSCCCPCCLHRLEVSSEGSVIGVVEEELNLCEPSFRILDASGKTVMRIESPNVTCLGGGSVGFNVLSTDGRSQGRIVKQQQSRLVRDSFRNTYNYRVSFPMNLDVKLKATLLGALFLIYSMYYESESKNNECLCCCGCCSNDSDECCNSSNNGYQRNDEIIRSIECAAYCCWAICEIGSAILNSTNS